MILFKGGRLWVASDELGAYKLYRDEAGTRFSSSFSALRASFASVRPDAQGVYEYAFNGATYGEKTFLREVRQQRHGSLYELEDDPPTRGECAGPRCPRRRAPFARRRRGGVR